MYMSRLFQRTLLAMMIAGTVSSASAFSMLGTFDTWQIVRLGYNPLNTDIGGPMNVGEEYRWNIRTITYGFDESFLNYFGQRGVDEINKAIAILNNLPKFSKMSTNLTEFSTDTKRVNYRASAVNLQDLKSTALSFLLEEMGLASPERYTWTLRDRLEFSGPIIRYLVIKRNFDPVTLAPSRYVNGTLYTYFIGEFVTSSGTEFADAVEVQVDPLAFGFRAVVSDADGFWGGFLLGGEFFTGLTRDDVGGLRYLYGLYNYNIENLIPGTFGGGGSPYDPAGVTNSAVDLALRPGVDKILFKQAKYDSVFGNFITNTVQYKDTFITNSHRIKQSTARVLTQPDILFSAEDLGQNAGGFPVGVRRTTAAPSAWINNDAINGQATIAGPGQIQSQIVITFNKVGPHILNQNPFFLDEADPLFVGFVWGSFDGTTNAPVVYPIGSSIEDLEQEVLGGN